MATKEKTAKLGTLKKSKKNKNKEVDEKNLENVSKKITNEKDLLYQYPTDVNTIEKRKKFRADARRTRDSFIKKIAKADKKDQASLKKEAEAWAKDIFTKAHQPQF